MLLATADADKINRAAKEMYELQAENLWVIGTVADTGAVLIYSKELGNIAIAKEKDYWTVTVADAAEQWFFK